ncbi:hypothetical protein RN001_012322 [Aquatica leii]|uniref:Cystinosin n=1 Tax=Aquatica leii TaxID=1421715 RepID=A0AAN7Q1H4_9COLE|nr:hypothetical protein RN001_012322 [Aquatica leii]
MRLFVLAIAFAIIQERCCNIQISTHEVFLSINERQTFTLNVTNLNVTDAIIEFLPEHEDIVNVEPSLLKIEAGNNSYELFVDGLSPGHSEVTTGSEDDIDLRQVFLIANVCKSKALDVISKIVGWTFIISWGASFYPQIYKNYKRQCVIGLHFDYWALDIVGYIAFGAFIHSLYFAPSIQKLYFNRYPRGLIPVKTNDVVYNLHGTFAIIVTIIQCIIYEKGEQTISKTARIILGFITVFFIISFILLGVHVLPLLDFLYYCSYIKLVITVLKYIPQAYMNYKRKSTDGWSIGVVFLDLNGGIFSILQMVLDSHNYNDWRSIFGNPTKFILGIITILFHCLFMIQHYVLYRNSDYILIR